MKGRQRLPGCVSTALLGCLLTTPVAAQDAPEGQDEPARGTAARIAEEPSPAGYTRRHALIIGIDEYEDPAYPDLGYAVADARAVAKVLVERFGFAEDDVRLLVNGDATQDALAESLEVWASDPDRVGENDLLVIFFAGHGVTRELGTRGSRGYMVPVDGRSDRRGQPNWATLVGMNDLEDVSEAIPSKHALFLLDCCFGGLATTRAAPPIAPGMSSRARQILTAGDADQEVLDSGGRRGHSVFTGAVLDALEGRADDTGDLVVSFGELYGYVNTDVVRKTDARQTPLQATFPDHEGGSVALFPPGVKPGGMSAAERLKAMTRSMEEQFAELQRLSDLVIADQLLDEQEDLYPAWPEMVPAIRDWLGRARELADRRSQHEESIRLVRQEAYLSQVVAGLLEEGEGAEPQWDKADPRLSWRFRTFTSLVERLDDVRSGITDVETRLAWALQVEDLTLNHPNAHVTWGEARLAIAAADGVAASELYAEQPIQLVPQLGLVPIGMNPVTGLWEFYHLRSAWNPRTGLNPAKIRIPVHREDATLEIREETGLVFVLIPGGTYRIGAQSSDPQAPHYDPQTESHESHTLEVVLEPYFISRYEMTQGQWTSVSGYNPSFYGPTGFASRINDTGFVASLTHPVETISWEDCDLLLTRNSLRLPSEDQWEVAHRGRTETAWPGSSPTELDQTANLADRYAKENGWPEGQPWESGLLDGNSVHARVGSFRANTFGLHDSTGNLAEWCLDDFSPRGSAGRTGDGARLQERSVSKVVRGGSFHSLARDARAASRVGFALVYSLDFIGCRPARVLDP